MPGLAATLVTTLRSAALTTYLRCGEPRASPGQVGAARARGDLQLRE